MLGVGMLCDVLARSAISLWAWLPVVATIPWHSSSGVNQVPWPNAILRYCAVGNCPLVPVWAVLSASVLLLRQPHSCQGEKCLYVCEADKSFLHFPHGGWSKQVKDYSTVSQCS